MLQGVKLTGRRQPHNYPKMQLTSLLVLQYWEKIDHCTHQMMQEDTGFTNEELGEIGFSILSRVCLGDHTKDNFLHMDQMYKLIGVYRDLKSEINEDNNVTTSLSWRHKIDINGEEVSNSKLFFQSCIRQIIAGRWMSYSHKMTTYTNIHKASIASNKEFIPLVYMTRHELDIYVAKTYEIINSDLHGYFVYPYHDIWPEAKSNPVSQYDDITLSSNDVDPDSDDSEFIAESEPINMLEHVEDSLSSISFVYSEDEDDEKKVDPGLDIDLSIDYSEGMNNTLNKSWHSWGRVSQEHEVVGRRVRKQREVYKPSKRRFL